jgi:uncharacterized protein YgiB involved in biofilm formation
MKRSRQLALLAVAQTPWALVGCGVQDTQPQALTKQGFYTSVEACERDGNSAELCRRASQTADTASTNEAPRYKNKADCIAEYGELCTEKHEAGGFWMPLMTGFMLSQMLSPGRAPAYLDSNPVYRTRAGQYTEAYRDRGGGAWNSPGARAGDGARMRPVDIAPNRAVTMSRSGFGSASAARSGWGGSSRGG